MRIPNTSTASRQGFTVIDAAVSLVIMGCVLALMIPLFAHSTDLGDSRARRDAQELCSICYEAQRAGVNFVVGSEVDTTVQNLIRGGEASSGRSFKAAGMSSEEAAAAAKYLRVDSGLLVVDLTADS